MIKRSIKTGVCVAALVLWASISAGQAQPATLEELQRFYPRVEDRANAALVYQKAVDSRVMGDYDRDLPILGGGKALPIPAKPFDPAVKAAMVKELENNTATRQLLHEAGTLTQCRFPVDLTSGPTMELS